MEFTEEQKKALISAYALLLGQTEAQSVEDVSNTEAIPSLAEVADATDKEVVVPREVTSQ